MVNPQLMISTDVRQGDLPTNYSTANLQCAQDVVCEAVTAERPCHYFRWQPRSPPCRHTVTNAVLFFNIAPCSIQNGLAVNGRLEDHKIQYEWCGFILSGMVRHFTHSIDYQWYICNLSGMIRHWPGFLQHSIDYHINDVVEFLVAWPGRDS